MNCGFEKVSNIIFEVDTMMKVENLSYIQAKNGSGKIAFYNTVDETDILKFVENNKVAIEEQLLKFGGIILRGFSIRSVSEFNKLAHIISPQLLEYTNRSTPRTNIGGKIYTATEYPADKHIPLHNENSYTLAWPDKIFFFCVIAPATGGETPIADSREVFRKLNPELIQKFNDKKVAYVRNYTSGIDLSWQEVFQTENKKEVEKYCTENKIDYKWHDANARNLELTTKQVCQATIKHLITGEDVWFNQAHLFHVSSLDEMDRDTLISVVGKDALPRNSYFGDGSEISFDDFKHIRDVYDSETIVFQWHKGDVMILDNILMAHARHPFTGERKIVVAMG